MFHQDIQCAGYYMTSTYRSVAMCSADRLAPKQVIFASTQVAVARVILGTAT